MSGIRLRYVNRDHSHPLYGAEGVMLVRSLGSKGGTSSEYIVGSMVRRRKGGPKAELVRLDDGRMVVAPYGNWRKAR